MKSYQWMLNVIGVLCVPVMASVLTEWGDEGGADFVVNLLGVAAIYALGLAHGVRLGFTKGEG